MNVSRSGGNLLLARALIAVGGASVIAGFFFPWLVVESVDLHCAPGSPARCLQIGPYLDLRSGFDISGTLLRGAPYNLIPLSAVALIPVLIALYLVSRAIWMSGGSLGSARSDFIVALCGLAIVIAEHLWMFTTTIAPAPAVIEAAIAMYVCFGFILAGIALVMHVASHPHAVSPASALGA